MVINMAEAKKVQGICEECEFYDVVTDDDRDLGEKICHADFDEDDYRQFLLSDSHRGCPYFKPYDEYKTVAKQN